MKGPLSPGCSDRGGLPFRWRLGTMMVVVALAAVCCRWPQAALGLSAMVGGPVVGGWHRRKRGDEGVIEGSILGGVGSYLAMFVVVLTTLAAAEAPSFVLARLPEILGLIVLGFGFFGVVGMIVGMFVGAVMQVGVAVVRERERRRRAALDWERLVNTDRSDP